MPRFALCLSFALFAYSATSPADTLKPAGGASSSGAQAAAQQPCTPSTANNLVAGARSLLSIASSIIDTKNDLSDASYSERAVSGRAVNKGNKVIDNLNALGITDKPCS